MRSLHAGLTNLVTARATGAASVSWATARRTRWAGFPGRPAGVGTAQAVAPLKARAAVIVRLANEILALAAVAVVAGAALAAVVVPTARPTLGAAAVRRIEVKRFAAERLPA